MNEEATGRYLAFDLGGQCFAIEVSRVEVVLETVPITRVPKAAAHLRGVINYRGAVIPVADLRIRFGEGPTSSSAGTSIIVLQVRYGSADITIGVLADTVREVIDLDPSSIERPPQLGAKAEDAFVQGICSKGGEFIIVLDIDEAFKTEAEAAERGTEPR
jgi:purine-binding chemotaxis protein CheW